MKSSVPPWAVAIAILVAVVVIGFLGWKQVKPPPALNDQAPPPFIDPVTHKPKSMAKGSGMPAAPTPGTGGAAAAGQSAGSQ
jgi:hypothetical protein